MFGGEAGHHIPGAAPAVDLLGGVAGGVAIKEQPAPREHLGGRRAQPPVDQVEVVGRLVDEEAAGVGLVPVPAAEVVGSVPDVE